MLTANEISSAIEQALAEGRPLAIVSVLTKGDQTTEQSKLLVNGDGKVMAGTLGDAALDELAATHAVSLLADDRKEIIVVSATDFLANNNRKNFSSTKTHEENTKGGTRELGFLREPSCDFVDKSFWEDWRLLFEISRPPLELVICGGGHVGQAVAVAGQFLGFKVTVIDDRIEFASRDKFPDEQVRLIADDFVAALQSLRITPASHIVIVTRGHRHDEICLQEVIAKPARYVGMIGSRRRTTTIRERLKREGVTPELLRRIHAPIGLDIGALTPEEIAVAILAEIILVRRGGTALPKSAEGPMARAR
ncbi:MAG: XdhC family protein [Blastocatellia bacterium]